MVNGTAFVLLMLFAAALVLDIGLSSWVFRSREQVPSAEDTIAFRMARFSLWFFALGTLASLGWLLLSS